MTNRVSCKYCGLPFDETHEITCLFKYELRCPFGCDTTGFSHQQLKQHREEKYYFHLDKTYSLLKEYGFDKAFKVEDNNSCSFEREVKSDLDPKLNELRKLFEEAIYLKKKLFLKQQERRDQMKLLEKAIDDSLLTSFNGILLWIVPETMRLMDVYYSPIFYTGKYGYRLRLQIEKNKEKNLNLIKLIFLKGIYDPILPEKFSTKLDIKCQIEATDEKIIKSISMDLSRISTVDNSTQKIIDITDIPSGSLSMIRFKMDCSEFHVSSID